MQYLWRAVLPLATAALLLGGCGADRDDDDPTDEDLMERSAGAPPTGGGSPTSDFDPSQGAGGLTSTTGGTGPTGNDVGAGGARTDAPSTGGATGAPDGSGGATAGSGATASGGASSECPVPPASNTPEGYGEATTGGGNRAPVVVSNFSEAEAALGAYRAAYKAGSQNSLVIHYDGTFNYASITDVCTQHSKDALILEIKEMENVTFRGLAGSSANFGIKINRAKNVIIQNMTMGLLPGGGDSDAITIEGNGTNGDVEHVWIDHNEFFSSTKDDCAGAGDTEFDGLIDIKKGARYITISYNYLHDHQKTGLLGHSDSDDVDRYVTFHHNWYENVVSRTPLHRFGYVHLYNNYYNQIASSGINVRMGGVALIEANYFENAANPVTSRYSDQVGYWDLRNNFVGPNITWSEESDTLANADDWLSTTSFPAGELTYSYSTDPAGCVKEIVQATAGARL